MRPLVDVSASNGAVMGSDYCLGIGDDHTVATVNRFNASPSAAEREMIPCKNATRFFKS